MLRWLVSGVERAFGICDALRQVNALSYFCGAAQGYCAQLFLRRCAR